MLNANDTKIGFDAKIEGLRYKVTKNVTGKGVYISSVQLRYLMIIHVSYIPYMYIVVIRECRIFLFFSVCGWWWWWIRCKQNIKCCKNILLPNEIFWTIGVQNAPITRSWLVLCMYACSTVKSIYFKWGHHIAKIILATLERCPLVRGSIQCIHITTA